MPNVSKLPANVTAIIRCVNKISAPAEHTINLLSHHVNQIMILFSGSEVEYASLSSKYESNKVICVFWVYSFGYLEPIIAGVKDKIINQWIMLFTDRDIPSEAFLQSLNMLIQKDVSGFMVQRVLEDDTAKRNIPSWLRYYLRPGFRRSYIPLLFRKDKVLISEIIHDLPKIIGKSEKLDPELYNVRRAYVVKEMENDETFVNHWIEKEVRYIFIEMFETRKSRAGAIDKIIGNVLFLRKIKIKSHYRSFLYSELSNFEYIIFELLRGFSMGSIGLTPYQKVKIKTIKDTRRFNSIGFFVSEFLRTKSESLITFLNMQSPVIDTHRNDLDDMALVEDSEYAFIKRLLIRFMETREGLNNIDIDKLIAQVKSFLTTNVDKYMPRL